MYASKTLLLIGLLLGCAGIAGAYDEWAEGEIIERSVQLPSYFVAGYGGSLNDPIRYTFVDHSHTGNTYIENIINTSNIPNVDLEFVFTHFKWTGTSYESVSEDYFTQSVRCSYTVHDYTFPDGLTGDYGKKVIYNSPYMDMTTSTMVEKYFIELYNEGYLNDQLIYNEFSDHPDVFEIEFNTTSNDQGMEFGGVAYLDIDSGLIATFDSADYGFALGGRGSDAGSGSIYKGINIYGAGEGDASGMGNVFNVMFWLLIPFIFILSVAKFIGRIL